MVEDEGDILYLVYRFALTDDRLMVFTGLCLLTELHCVCECQFRLALKISGERVVQNSHDNPISDKFPSESPEIAFQRQSVDVLLEYVDRFARFLGALVELGVLTVSVLWRENIH